MTLTTDSTANDTIDAGVPRIGTAKNEWVAVCTKKQLIPERGVAVLVRDQQVALFRISNPDGADFVYAVGHRDPFADANVIARGIVGSAGNGDAERDTVASPMFKHVFDLATGECLTDPSGRLPVYRTWIAGGVVYVHPVPVPVPEAPATETPST